MGIIEENGIRGLYLASAYEGMARAYTAAGESTMCWKYIELAKAEGRLVEDDEELEIRSGLPRRTSLRVLGSTSPLSWSI